MYRRILCFVLCSAVLVQGFIEDCGSKIGSFNAVTVTNCKADSKTCLLKRGTNSTISINFNINQDVKEVKAEVHGIVFNLPVPFPLSQPDGCLNSGLSCPLKKDNGPYQYSATLSVLKSYPKLKVDVKWELKDENEENIVCVLIHSRINDSSK